MRFLIPIFILTLCSLCVTAQPKEKYKKLVDSLIKTDRTEQLIPYFKKELRSNPGSEDILRWLGRLYISFNKPDTGEMYYRKALAINPKCAHCYSNIGHTYAMRKDNKKALEMFDRSISLDAKDAELYATRAEFKEETGDKFEALFDYNKAIELDPKNADYYINRGKFNSAQGYFSLAIGDLDKAIELAPERYYPHSVRSGAYYNNHMFSEALKDINKAIALDSTQQILYNNRGIIYTATNEHEKAIASFTKAIELEPKDYLSYYYRGYGKYKMEDMDGACTDMTASYARLVKTDTGNELKNEIEYLLAVNCDAAKPSYYYQRGIAFYNLQQYDKAIVIYTQGLNKFPTSSMTLSFRGNAYFAHKDYANALADYDASIKNKANLAADIGINQRHTGLAGESMATYISAFLASMQVSIAESRFALGQYDEALTEINKGIAIAPDIKEFGRENYYNVRGNIFLALGKNQQALDDFDKCTQINPSFPLAWVNKAVAQMNLANKVTVRSYSIRGGVNSNAFNGNWSWPINTVRSKPDGSLASALTDCDKAIALAPALDFAYYIRGLLKKMLNKDGYCYDLVKAADLGYIVEPPLLKECGK